MHAELVSSALLIGAFLYWSRAQHVKDIAFAATQRQCRLCEVLMLDEYIALRHCALARDNMGKIRIRRRFTFEFSATGEERYQGTCVMLGCEVAAFEMPAYRLQADSGQG